MRGLTWRKALAFIEDVLVLGRDFQEHTSNLREVLDRFRVHNLKLKPAKCHLVSTKVKSLGKVVTGDLMVMMPQAGEPSSLDPKSGA